MEAIRKEAADPELLAGPGQVGRVELARELETVGVDR
jgi:hypothetical protein